MIAAPPGAVERHLAVADVRGARDGRYGVVVLAVPALRRPAEPHAHLLADDAARGQQLVLVRRGCRRGAGVQDAGLPGQRAREGLAQHILAQAQALDLGRVLAPVALAKPLHEHAVELIDRCEPLLAAQGLDEVHGLADDVFLGLEPGVVGERQPGIAGRDTHGLVGHQQRRARHEAHGRRAPAGAQGLPLLKLDRLSRHGGEAGERAALAGQVRAQGLRPLRECERHQQPLHGVGEELGHLVARQADDRDHGRGHRQEGHTAAPRLRRQVGSATQQLSGPGLRHVVPGARAFFRVHVDGEDVHGAVEDGPADVGRVEQPRLVAVCLNGSAAGEPDPFVGQWATPGRARHTLPPVASRSSCVPRWTTLPLSRTMISSQSRIVLRRCAMMMQVQPRRRRLSSIRVSVVGSSALRRLVEDDDRRVRRPARGRSRAAGAGRR